jgi:small-conductance mechanosensitive channel
VIKLAKLTCADFLTTFLVIAILGISPVHMQAKHTNKGVFRVASNPRQDKQQSQDVQSTEVEDQSPVEVPDLVEIIPLASALFDRLADLEKRISELVNVDSVEKGCAEIEANLEGPVAELEEIKAERHRGLNRLTRLRETISLETKSLENTNKPLRDAIRRLESWRTEWLAEKKQWAVWRSSLQKEEVLDQLELTFVKVDETIGGALVLILPRLNAMLASQERISQIEGKINAIISEVNSLIEGRKLETLMTESPPMFTAQYYAQFGSDMRYALERGLAEISWSSRRFFARQGWIIFIQICLALFISLTLYRKRHTLEKSERWSFLAVRPFSAGLFFFSMTAMLIYAYEGAPPIWSLANTAIAAVSFARLIGTVIKAAWKRHFVYGLMMVLIVLGLMDVLSFPLPLYRLFAVLTSLAGFFFCLRWARDSRRPKDSRFYTWALRLVSLFFAVIFVTEVWGKEPLALFVFSALIDSIATVLVFMLFLYMIHGGVDWLFRSSPLRRAAVFKDNMDDAIDSASRFFDTAIIGLVLIPALLMIWGVYDSLGEATKGLLGLGLNLRSHRITVGLLIVVAGIIYGTYFVSWILQKLLVDVTFARHRVAMGVRQSIARLVHYVVSLIGFLFALSTLGFEISKITIMLSALGVGIGFGLQGIVNNFVCGLIMLFERPVRVGDIIEIGGKWAEIKKIGTRATTVRTYDQADVIVPNADLIGNQVTNWTLSNRRARLIIPVGVAYGSDILRVMEILKACADENPNLAKQPPPQVLFLSFGESCLDFELRVIVPDADDRLSVRSQLHQEIDRRFRESNIEIAFPQQDLHLRSLDESIVLQSPKSKG